MSSGIRSWSLGLFSFGFMTAGEQFFLVSHQDAQSDKHVELHARLTKEQSNVAFKKVALVN